MKHLAPIVVVVVATLWAHVMQPRLTTNGGTGADGWSYATMARRYAGLPDPWASTRIDSPFRERIGLPLLAAAVMRLTRLDVVPAFLLINTIAAAVAAWCLYLWWVEVGVPMAGVGLLLFCTQWVAPIRYTSWYPTVTDPLGWSFYVMGLLGLERIRQKRRSGVVLLAVALFAGTLTRENIVVLWTGTIAFTRTRRGLWLCLVMAVITACAYGLAAGNGLFAHASHFDRRFAMAATRPGLIWIAFAMAFGPVCALIPIGFMDTVGHFRRYAYELPIFATIAVLALLGPAEERVYFWLAPFVYEAVLFALARLRLWERRGFELLVALVAAQSLSARVWWPMPDFPFSGESSPVVWLTPWGGNFFFGEVTAWWASPATLATLKTQYLVTFAGLALLIACHLLRLRRSAV